MDGSKSLAARFGIPAAIPIPDHRRYTYCNAVEAVLVDVSPDGQLATYSGTCACGHLYTDKIATEELRRRSSISLVNGEPELVYNAVKVNKGSLGEY